MQQSIAYPQQYVDKFLHTASTAGAAPKGIFFGVNGDMQPASGTILTLNCGSSSLKFALFSATTPLQRILSGHINRIGDESSFGITMADGEKLQPAQDKPAADMAAAVKLMAGWLARESYSVSCIGHRIVQGGLKHAEPEAVTEQLLQSLDKLTPLAPGHLPASLAAIRIMQQLYPQAPQVACFDTAFHRYMPFAARHYALPRPLWEEGLVRYGFHGLSYESIIQQLQEVAPEAVTGRLIIAHLGNGASMAAVYQGQSLDTTMGLTPAGGLVMSTRAGDMDPGAVLYLLQEKKMSPDALNELLNKQAGLKAVSGSSGDIQELLEQEANDCNAAEALQLFCYQAKKFIGALAAVLGGLDTLVFTGGIGEHAAPVRLRICEGLEFLGIELDEQVNSDFAAVISAPGSRVTVRVIPTDEELVIAQHAWQYMQDH